MSVDREARSFKDAHLQAEALKLTLGTKIAHRLAHADRGRQWRGQASRRSHHGIADGLTTAPITFRRDTSPTATPALKIGS